MLSKDSEFYNVSSSKDYFDMLPTDVIMDIMLRFDCKSVLRGRRVRKWWRNLLDEHQFVMSHRQSCLALSNKSILIVTQDIFSRIGRGRHMKFTEVIVDNNAANIIPNKLELSISKDSVHRVIPISCDIICFKLFDKITLLNPVTNKFRDVNGPFESCDEGGIWNIAFDYLEEVRMYYILCLKDNEDGSMNAFRLNWEAGHTFVDDNEYINPAWNAVEGVCSRIVLPDGLFVGNKVFWVINRMILKDEEIGNDLLVCFDIEFERFQVISSPDCSFWNNLNNYSKNGIRILNMQGKFCLTHDELVFGSRKFHLWSYDSDDNEDMCSTWRKMYEVSLNFPFSVYFGAFPYHYDHPYCPDWHLVLNPKSSVDGELIFPGPNPGVYYIYRPHDIHDAGGNCCKVKEFTITWDPLVGIGFFWKSIISV